MPFKRPEPPSDSDAVSSSSVTPAEPSQPPRKKSRPSQLGDLLKGVKIFVLQTKLEAPTIAELLFLIERSGAELCKDVKEASVIITAVRMRKRLERHIDWKIAKSKAVVTPDWLRDSVQKKTPMHCGDYAALQDLEGTTEAKCPTESDGETSTASPALSTPPPQRHFQRKSSSPHTPSREPGPSKSATPPPANLLPPDPPYEFNPEDLDYRSRFACMRASPLKCPNQELCEMLDVMRQTREVEGEERSELSYRRAVAVIKSYPTKIKYRREAEKLPYIGTKLISMIEEYLDTGHISEVDSTLASPRFHSLTAFSSIYGIGPKTAQYLYGLGLTTIEQLETYYGVKPSEQGVMLDSEKDARDVMEENWIKVALGLRHDLAIKIPREGVEEIHRVIMAELDEVEPGCVSTVVGGYRRGKTESGDVDIVFTHPNASRTKGLCKRFMKRLYEKGLVTHVMHLSGFHTHNALRTTHWDSLEKALTIFVLPGHTTRRRVDFIFAQPETYWTAVVGWTGSLMFERDLRLWAKQRGLKFDSSGMTRRRDSKHLYPQTEKEVFDILGLPWIDPTMRNADV
ncbi:hypothetical protein EWM64_g845 [Hericium alpestre]|uniref:DNA polymerase n=1 Tax=Hericium alpestre TaxID=135208 RepID=A0A4Z0AA80_9AGAM|nr:hypothetical protein EWM64_g845 [Hericium alpestre]